MKALRYLIRASSFVILVSMPGLTSGSNAARVDVAQLRRIEQQIHSSVNIQRSSHHKPPLDWNERIAEESRRHARNIAAEGFFAHEDPRRGDIDTRLSRIGIDWKRCAENLYAGDLGNTAADAVRAWNESPGHRQIMLDSMFSETGVGVAVRRDGVVVVVEEFILK